MANLVESARFFDSQLGRWRAAAAADEGATEAGSPRGVIILIAPFVRVRLPRVHRASPPHTPAAHPRDRQYFAPLARTVTRVKDQDDGSTDVVVEGEVDLFCQRVWLLGVKLKPTQLDVARIFVHISTTHA